MNKILVKYVLLPLFLFLGGNLYAQNKEAKELLDKVAAFYENSSAYQVELTYNMHRGLTGNNITESYKGSIIKNGSFLKMELLDSEILQFKEAQLIIDNSAKQVLYIDKSTGLDNSPLNISAYLDYYTKTVVTNKGNIIVCEMVPQEISGQLPYGKVVLYINKDTYSLEKQELFFSNLIPFKNENNEDVNDYGRLVIELKHQKLNEDQKTYKLSDYISISSGDEASLTGKYSGYNLIKQNL